MVKKNRLWKWIIILIIIFPIINFYLPVQNLPEEYKMELEELNKIEDDTEFIRAVYDNLHNKFNSERRCWKNYYWKNYLVNGENIFQLEGECLPCHIQNNLLQDSLIASGRFRQEQVKTILTVCWEAKVFHVYSEVHLDGEILNVDLWGSHWNVPFGETIHDSEVCNK